MRINCKNGTVIRILRKESSGFGPATTIHAPGFPAVLGEPHLGSVSYRDQAVRLGYRPEAGPVEVQMCLDHDPLHALLCDWLGLPFSHSLAWAAGSQTPENRRLGQIEERAVLAVQELMVRAGGKLPT